MAWHRAMTSSGEPYGCQCRKTARLTAEALALAPARWQIAFQSRVGRKEWLRPYTDETLDVWGREGIEKVHVICPGFAADCLETLEEVAVTNRDRFLAAGGKEFGYIPALNDRAEHLELLMALVLQHVAGWPQGQVQAVIGPPT